MTRAVPAPFSEVPFGRELRDEEVAENLSFFDDWEDRYRYIIDLGKKLPSMPAERRTPERIIHGCQSQVWIDTYYDADQDRLYFEVDSDALIVRGLAGVVLSALNGRTPAQILAFDIEDFFTRIDLLGHLSPTRGNGLRAMVARIRSVAESLHH